MTDQKKMELLNAIFFNVNTIQKDLIEVNFSNPHLRQELLEVSQDIKDMKDDIDEIFSDLSRSLNIIERIVEDHLYHISTIDSKPRKFRIVK